MSLQFLCGSAGSGKSYQLYTEIIKESKTDIETDYLLIVPEQFTLQTQKDIVTLHPDHGVMNVDILSFLRFAYRIFDEVGGNELPVLEDTGKSMVLRKVVAEKKKQLIFFNSSVNKPGFIGELKSLLSEFYQYNIQNDDFGKMEKIAEKKPMLAAKLKDIHTLYEGFGTFMKERYITAEETLLVLDKVIDQSKWLKGSVICLDGFTGFTPCQLKILAKMMQYAKKVMITVTIDPKFIKKANTSEHQLFGLSIKTTDKLHKIAKETNTLVDEPFIVEGDEKEKVPYRFLGSPALAHLEQNIFRYPYKICNEDTKDISIHTGRNANCEVSFVVREINRLVREEGYRYQDIAVVTGDVEQYGRIIKQSFFLAKIPCFIDYKKDILNNPFVELIRAAISIVSEDYSYESVFRYLRTGLTEVLLDDIDLFENYILATGIRGNKRYHEPFTKRFKSKETIDFERINKVRALIVEELSPLFEVLKNKESTIRDYTAALYELGIRLNIEKKLEDYSSIFEEKGALLLAKEFEQIYRITMELFDQIVLLLGTEHCSLKEYAEMLDTGFSEVKVGLIPPGVDVVVIGDTERTRLKSIRALFFIGVNEGIIPRATGNGGILSDMERELLINNDIELAPTKRQQAFTEQFYLYLNMTKPKEKLYLTYHKVNEEGKSVNPSFLIGKLITLFPKIKIQNEDGNTKDMEHILSDAGLTYLADGLRNYHEKEVSNLFKELFLYYRSKEATDRVLQKFIEGAFYINHENGISKEVASLLYGNELKGSVTRLERYAGCAFSHFMSYGLSLEERQEYKLAIPDVGNIFHNAIDGFSKRLSKGEYTWHTIPEEVRDKMAIESVMQAVEDYENSYIRSTKRNEYMIKRIERITVRTLWALCNQIKQGAFEPMGYEMPFYHMPDTAVTLTGRIDRLDIYENTDNVYVRVIDYKSGSTSFDINSVYYGLQQQLAVYLSAAMDYLKNKYEKKDVVPSGIFYYHIDDPLVAKSERAEEEIFKSLRMNGLVNENKEVLGFMDQKLAGPDGTLRASVKSDIIAVETNKEGEPVKRSQTANKNQMLALMNYVNKKLAKDSTQILNGDVKLNPYRMGERTACDFCEYRSACGFDLRLPGHSYRNLAKKPVDEMKEEIWGTKE